MKIAVIGLRGFPDTLGGIETHCENLYPRLADMGHNVVVYGRLGYMRASVVYHDRLRVEAIRVNRTKNWETLEYTVRALRRAVKEKPDVIHFHALGPSFFVPVGRVLRIKTVATHHGFDYQRAKWGRTARAFLRLGERVMRQADAVICVSDHIREALAWREAYYVPNGVQVARPPAPSEILQTLGVTPGEFFLFAGRFVPEKELPLLIDAFLQTQTPWMLVIAGAGDPADPYTQRIHALAAQSDRIVLAGFQSGPALENLFAHAGAFVLPSSVEGLPIALLEALSYGLPVVASDIAPHRAVGYAKLRLVPLRHTEEWTAALGHVADAADGRDTEAIDFVREHFSWDAIARETDRIYRNVSR